MRAVEFAGTVAAEPVTNDSCIDRLAIGRSFLLPSNARVADVLITMS
jgi:hypothetical protein